MAEGALGTGGAGVLKTFLLTAITGAISINVYLAVTEVAIFHAATVAQISQWDWSNVAGATAFQGGWNSAALGFCLHLVVSAVWGAIAILCARQVKALAEHPVIFGFFFGLFVMCVMRYGIVPLGHARIPHASAAWMANLICAHTIFFGIPVALVASKAARPK